LGSVGSPGSVGASRAPPTAGHGLVLKGPVSSAVVAFAAQRELQRAVGAERPAQVRLRRSHLRRVQIVPLRQQLIGRDVDEQLVRANPAIQQDPPNEVRGVRPRVQGPTGGGGAYGAARMAAVSF